MTTDLLHLTDGNTCPPDGFRYVCHEDGTLITAMDRETWLGKIRDHAKQNDHALPDDWRQMAEHNLCALLPPGWCEYGDGTVSDKFASQRFTQEDFLDGMTAMEAIIHATLVDREEAERRAKICAGCVANMQIPGCGPCYQISEWIGRIIGARATKSDQFLKACAACKCSNKVSVWTSAGDLKAITSPEKLDTLRLFPHCWKWKAIDEAP